MATSSLFIVSLLLLAYPNLLAWQSTVRRWDQWSAFMWGNASVGVGLLLYTLNSGLAVWGTSMPGQALIGAVWGTSMPGQALIGALWGAVPLAVITILMLLPGPLGSDIITSGIGDLRGRQIFFRMAVQVALATVLFEEFAFRGVLYLLLERQMAQGWAVFFNALIYGFWHLLLQYNGFAQQRGLQRWAMALGGVAIYTLLGFLLAGLRASSGGLLAPLVAHAVLDLGMFTAMTAVRARRRVA